MRSSLSGQNEVGNILFVQAYKNIGMKNTVKYNLSWLNICENNGEGV
jgi:hypothetical protein